METAAEPASSPFGIRLGDMFRQAGAGYWTNRNALTLWSLATLAVYYGSTLIVNEGQSGWTQVGLSIAGMVATTVVAYPWFREALGAVDEAPPALIPGRFFDQTVAALFFWAGVLLGFRYLYGIPALFVFVMYAFFGYAVADEPRRGGLKALGWSVHLGTKRRIGIFAILAILTFFNLLALIPIGLGSNPTTVAATFLLLTVTTNISIVSGAVVYRVLERKAVAS